MAVFSKDFLSTSTNGKPITVTAISLGTAQLIHEVPSNSKDELWLYAYNSNDTDYPITITIDGTNYTELSVPSKSGVVLICPGQLLNTGMQVKAFSSITSAIYLSGWVNRIA
jgi:hypothetical protein